MIDKKQKERNILRFKHEVLSLLIDRYYVNVYPHFYKFECDGFVYDYYPAKGRLNRVSNIDYKLNKWSDCSIDDFIELFLNRA